MLNLEYIAVLITLYSGITYAPREARRVKQLVNKCLNYVKNKYKERRRSKRLLENFKRGYISNRKTVHRTNTLYGKTEHLVRELQNTQIS